MILEKRVRFKLKFNPEEEKQHSFTILLNDCHLLEIRNDIIKRELNCKLLDLTNDKDIFSFSLPDNYGFLFKNFIKGKERIIGFKEIKKTVDENKGAEIEEFYRIVFIKPTLKTHLASIQISKLNGKYQEELTQFEILFEQEKGFTNCLNSKIFLYNHEIEDGKERKLILLVEYIPSKLRVITFDLVNGTIENEYLFPMKYIYRQTAEENIEILDLYFDELTKTIYLVYSDIQEPYEFFIVGFEVNSKTFWLYPFSVKLKDSFIKSFVLSEGQLVILKNCNSSSDSHISSLNVQQLKSSLDTYYEKFKLPDQYTLYDCTGLTNNTSKMVKKIKFEDCLFDGSFIVNKFRDKFAVLNILDGRFIILNKLFYKNKKKKTSQLKQRKKDHHNFMISGNNLNFIENMSLREYYNHSDKSTLEFRLLNFSSKTFIYAHLIETYNHQS